MTIKEVLEKNPNIADELRLFFSEVLTKSLEGKVIPLSFKKLFKEGGVTVLMVENYLISTPRLICDFMDKKNIIILINFHENQGFSFTINGEPSEQSFDERKEAETQAIIDSINIYKTINI